MAKGAGSGWSAGNAGATIRCDAQSRACRYALVHVLPLVLFLGLAANDVRAQQVPRDTIVTLRPIDVMASLLSSLGPTVRAGITGHALRIDSAHLSAWRPSAPNDALQRTSAAAYDDLGSRFKQSAVLRGFTVGPIVGMPQGVSVFVDGVPMNEAGSGDVAFDLLPMPHVERVEVLTVRHRCSVRTRSVARSTS